MSETVSSARTLLRPRDSGATPKTALWSSLPSGALPADLLRESVPRLQAIALLYAFTCFMAALVPVAACDPCRPQFFAEPRRLLPTFLSIAMGLAMFAVKLTAENVVGGTPAFMAPEQVLGESPLDGRTDIYATGYLAYWLLTGHKDPDRRPQTVDELSEHLRAALNGSAWTREQAARWWAAHRPQGSIAPAHA